MAVCGSSIGTRPTTPTTTSPTSPARRGRSYVSMSTGEIIGGPVWIPHLYNDSRKRTFFFVNEEWRKLVLGSTPSIVNTIAADNFPTAGEPLAYSVPSNGTVPKVP